jgi:chorismate mutase/prephenate dehydratase
MTDTASPLESHRAGIDAVDRQILELLAERRRLTTDIASAKLNNGLAFHDIEREERLLAERVATARELGLDPGVVVRLWEQILDDSLRMQLDMVGTRRQRVRKVAFQGAPGAFSHLAARRMFGEEGVEFVGLPTFADAVEAVEKGRADAAVLPVENTTSGSIVEVYDLLIERDLAVTGEVKLPVAHRLLGLEGATLDGIRRVLAHPQAVAQCAGFLRGLGAEIVYSWDTAGAAEDVIALGDPSVAAVASEEAAQIRGLQVLAPSITDRPDNFTRFLAISKQKLSVQEGIPTKTTVVLSVGNEPGSLLQVLAEFGREAISLVKLESRPNPDDPWEETFILDFEGNEADEAVARALDGVGRKARFMRVLGSYPSSDLRPHRRRPVAKPAADAPQAEMPAPSVRNVSVPKLARRNGAGDTVVEVGGVAIGGNNPPVLIAGPCAVESREQVMECARATREAGGVMLRGGCFKPRTSPYSFQGLGFEGLELLAEAGRAHGLPIVTEVLSPEQVGPVAEVADVLQIGARNMQNFALLSAVGKIRKPVLLKRGMSATIEEFLAAAEYVLAAGNRQVILCERGIRTFETATRNTLDVAAVPVLRELTHLPVVVDPSHAAGTRSLVVPLGRAGLAAGAHGLLVEIHPKPEEALSDGPQALLPEELTLFGV